MAQESSMHAYLNWTKQRIDEMDATLASLEGKAGQMTADAKTKAEQLIASLKQERDAFQAKVEAQTSEAARQANQAQLEALWKTFEGQVKSHFETSARQIDEQQAAFRDIAAAQAKAWAAAADTFQSEIGKVAAAGKSNVEAAVRQMKADAAEAEARLEKLKQAGGATWAALGAALAESRKAFDQANQKAADAVKAAESPKV